MKVFYRRILPAAAALAVCLLLNACTLFGNKEVTVSKASKSEATQYFSKQIYNSDGIAEDAENFLSGNLLTGTFERNPVEALQKLKEYYQISRDRKYLIIAADLCRGKAMKSDAQTAVSCYLSSLYYCMMLIRLHDISPVSSDSLLFYRVIFIYNDACAGIFRYLKKNNLLDSKAFVLVDLEGKSFRFSGKHSSFSIPEDCIEDYSLCADYKVESLMQRTRTVGLGVPLIAYVKDRQLYESLKMPEHMTIPVTYMIKTTEVSQNQIDVEQFFQDTTLSETMELVTRDVVFSGLHLSVDISTPLACFLNNLKNRNMLLGMLNTEKEIENSGLFMLEPYNPHKIPVVFVHGLMSSPNTWMQMINSLKNDPTIRRRYQIWFYSYSSGAPIFFTAISLRKALLAAQKEFCTTPETERNFNQMVLVGHSMGGMVTRTMLQKDPCHFFKFLMNVDMETMESKLKPEDRKLLEDSLSFPSLPFVHRAIFIASPHKGSKMAQWSIARLGIKLIKLPAVIIQRYMYFQDLVAQIEENSGVKLNMPVTIFNGIDNLNPDNPFVLALGSSEMKDDLTYHSIIGNREGDNIPGGSDGVVPYSSSHLDHAASELIVKSGHSVHRTPGAIREVLRILLLNLKENEKEPVIPQSHADN